MAQCPNCNRAERGIQAGPCLGGNCGAYGEPMWRPAGAPPLIQFALKGGRQPTQPHPGDDAGWDLYTSESTVIAAGGFKDIPTGLYVALPRGWWGFILSRSSTLGEHGLRVTPAVIDNGYRGEWFVQVHNPNVRAVMVDAGSRLAQFVPLPIMVGQWLGVEKLPPSSRGDAGFGSSGK